MPRPDAIPLSRADLDSLMAEPALLQLWIWCLREAADSVQWVTVRTGRGQTQIPLQPGQLVFARHTTAAQLAQRPTATGARLKRLAKRSLLSIQPDTHHSLVTITPWPRCASGPASARQPTRQPTDNQPDNQCDNQPTTNRQPTKARVSGPPRTPEPARDTKPPEKNKEGNTPPISMAPPRAPPSGTKRLSMDEQAAKIYTAYPRQLKPLIAKRAIEKALKTECFAILLEATQAFAQAQDGRPKDERKFIPHPSSWFNAGCWKDKRKEWHAWRPKGEAESDPAPPTDGDYSSRSEVIDV